LIRKENIKIINIREKKVIIGVIGAVTDKIWMFVMNTDKIKNSTKRKGWIGR
jgi:hypothetical protein